MTTTAVDALAAPIAASIVDDDSLAKDVALATVLLNGRKLKADLADAVTDANMRLTIEGASELRITFEDSELTILNSGLLTNRCDVEIDGLFFRLVGFEFAPGRLLTLVFEDREVAILRGYTRPRRAYRDKVTRARFALSLVREAKTIRFFCPELNVVQPVAGTKSARKAPGFSPDETVKVRDRKATREQRRILERVLDVGDLLNVPRKVLIASVAAAVAESAARNKRLDGGVAGVFAQRPGTKWGTLANVRDIDFAATSFFTYAMKAYRANPGRGAAAIAQTVQGARSSTKFSAWVPEATSTVNAYLGDTSSAKDAREERTKAARYAFTRGAPGGPVGENTWDCLQRLADEVGWRCYMVRAVVYFISEAHLFRAKPIATITPQTDWCDDPDFRYDTGQRVAEVRVSFRVRRWSAPPGAIVKIDGYGPGSGRYLVSEIDRSLFSTQATATLQLPRPKLPEPAAETITVPATQSGSSSTSSSNVPAKLEKGYDEAVAIDRKQYPYRWGGGHNSTFSPSAGSPAGYDCSGAVSRVLHAMGELSTPKTSGQLRSFGVAGEGKYLTIWTNDKHVFLEWKYPGKGREHWGTGRWGESHDGPGFKPNMHSKSGFVARHVRGL